MKYYAKVSKHDLRGAVETLPKLTPSDTPHESMAQASTGTDGQPIRKLFATYLPPDQDARMRLLSVAGEMASPDSQEPTSGETLENKAQDHIKLVLPGLGTERGGDSNPRNRFPSLTV